MTSADDTPSQPRIESCREDKPPVEPFGATVIDKPAGITSHDVVNRLRRRLGTKRIGHAGTLDPMATGVLVVCVGAATRIMEYLPTEPKVYHAGVTFGIQTDTQDVTGSVVDRKDASWLTERHVLEALQAFYGRIMQTPPMVSAVQVGGRRLYDHARRGTTVERQPRPVTVHRIELRGFVPGEHPVAALYVECSSGTYIRTLAADIGDRLGCGAAMSDLRRTRVGAFDIAEALAPDAEPHLIPIERALQHLPLVELGAPEWADIANGRAVVPPTPSASVALAGCDTGEPCLALARRRGEGYAMVRLCDGRLQPIKVMRLRSDAP